MKLFSLFDIPVNLHFSFLALIFLILIFNLGKGTYIVIANLSFITLLFTSVIIHEYAHIFEAKKFNIKTKQILLTCVGGLSQFEKFPEKPIEELKISLAGPLSSFAIAIVSYIFYLIIPFEIIKSVSIINLILAVFNSLPLFPSDGGRIARAAIQLIFNVDIIKATKIVIYYLGYIWSLMVLCLLPRLDVLIILLFLNFAAIDELSYLEADELFRNRENIKCIKNSKI